jgi:hypothetical protein
VDLRAGLDAVHEMEFPWSLPNPSSLARPVATSIVLHVVTTFISLGKRNITALQYQADGVAGTPWVFIPNVVGWNI